MIERWAFAALRRLWSLRRRKDMIIRTSLSPEFWNVLWIRKSNFIRPPSENQRNSLLTRALNEFTADLRHLHGVSKRFVAGSERVPIQDEWTKSKAHYDRFQLIIAGQQVMQDWERPLMMAMAKVAAETHGDVLEVGFGMGISATYVQENGVRSHTIVECNDDVMAEAQNWKNQYPERDIRLIQGNWQDVVSQLGTYDGILFDTYLSSEEEIHGIGRFEPFFPLAVALLRSGGVFTYYTDEIDSLSRRHQRLILKHFRSFAISIVRPLAPPEDCQYWFADSMVVVKAIK